MKRVRRVAIWVLVLVMMLTACGSNKKVNTVVQDGMSAFKEGKKEEELTLVSADDLLDTLIEKYSNSYDPPTPANYTPDQVKNIIDNTDPDLIIGGTGSTTPEPTTVAPDTATTVQETTTNPTNTPTVQETTANPTNTPTVQETTTQNPSKNGQIIVKTRDEFKEYVHQMLDETKTILKVTCNGSYKPTVEDGLNIYRELEREDPMDAICMASCYVGNKGNKYTFMYEYHIDVKTLRKMKKETRPLLDKAIKEIDVKGKSDYEIVRTVNKYVSDLVVYPEKEPYAEETHTAYSALKNGSAVCDGYAKTAMLLLNHFGVKCDFVVGECNTGTGHAWNLVQLDNKWYQLDVTWNDTGEALYDASKREQFLLVTDAFMKQSRTWDESLYPKTPVMPYRP